MATTQAQRASLFNTLAELMGTEDAETLMQQLPPGDWDSMATKDDLQVLGQVLAATFTAALADTRVAVTNAIAETNVAMHAGFAEAAKERAEIVKSQAEIVKSQAEHVKSQAEHVKSQAEIIKSQARNLYITVSTIVLATISIWIALLVNPTGA